MQIEKKQLQEEYKNRCPEMGIVSYRCISTNESFLAAFADIKASFNSTRAQLSGRMYPNKRLMELWKQYGEDGFELAVIKVLKYESPLDDHTKELEELRESCLEADKKASKLWDKQ